MTTTCAVCDHEITGDDYDIRHTGHEPDCTQSILGTCQCDISWHDTCCPECTNHHH